MFSSQKMQSIMSFLLLIGTLFSATLVMIGGTLYLIRHGHESLQYELLHHDPHLINIEQVWHVALGYSSLGIIQLGLLALIATQLIRVALLNWFYLMLRDYWFIFITLFILLVLLYSTFWRF